MKRFSYRETSRSTSSNSSSDDNREHLKEKGQRKRLLEDLQFAIESIKSLSGDVQVVNARQLLRDVTDRRVQLCQEEEVFAALSTAILDDCVSPFAYQAVVFAFSTLIAHLALQADVSIKIVRYLNADGIGALLRSMVARSGSTNTSDSQSKSTPGSPTPVNTATSSSSSSSSRLMSKRKFSSKQQPPAESAALPPTSSPSVFPNDILAAVFLSRVYFAISLLQQRVYESKGAEEEDGSDTNIRNSTKQAQWLKSQLQQIQQTVCELKLPQRWAKLLQQRLFNVSSPSFGFTNGNAAQSCFELWLLSTVLHDTVAGCEDAATLLDKTYSLRPSSPGASSTYGSIHSSSNNQFTLDALFHHVLWAVDHADALDQSIAPSDNDIALLQQMEPLCPEFEDGAFVGIMSSRQEASIASSRLMTAVSNYAGKLVFNRSLFSDENVEDLLLRLCSNRWASASLSEGQQEMRMLLASLTSNLLTALNPDIVNRMALIPTEKRLTIAEAIAKQLLTASRSFLRDLDDTDDIHNSSSTAAKASSTLSRHPTLSQSSASSSSQNSGLKSSAGSSEEAVPVQALVCAAHFALLLHALLCPPATRTHTSSSSSDESIYQLVKQHLPRESLWLARRVLKAYLSLCMSSRPSLAHAVADGSVRSAPAICLSVLEEDNLKQCLHALRSFELLDTTVSGEAPLEDGKYQSVAVTSTSETRGRRDEAASNDDSRRSNDQEPSLSGWKRKRKLGTTTSSAGGAKRFI